MLTNVVVSGGKGNAGKGSESMTELVRHTLPTRRFSETRRVVLNGSNKVYLTIGYDPAEPDCPREIFYSGGFRSGSDLEYQMQDVCVMLSLLLQHGVEPLAIAKSMARRETAMGELEYATIVGCITEELSNPPSWAADWKTE